MTGRRRVRSILRRIGRAAAAAAAWAAAGTMLAWLAGRILSDRTAWSQWLAWIPTPAAALVACAGFALAFRLAPPRRRRRQIAWTAAAALVAAHLVLVEHRAWRPAAAADGGALKLVHWNVSVPWVLPLQEAGRAVIDLDGDLTILSNGGAVVWQDAVRAWLGPAHRPLLARPFTVLTRLPVLELRTLVATDDGVAVALLAVETFPGARPTIIYLFDLPSDPRVGRMDLARRVRAMLEETGAPPPDLAVGDFNMTRGGAALAAIVPGLSHAYETGGHGVGATFPRIAPLYHIDHVLLGEDVACPRYDLATPTVGYHRAQVAWITRSRAPEATPTAGADPS